MSFPYGPPYPVSPLIRGARFALLILGIFYARVKQTMYNSVEADYKAEKARIKALRDKELEGVRAKIASEEKENVKALESGKLFDSKDGK